MSAPQPPTADGFPCPSCGVPASGQFCSTCGASLAARPCSSCGSALGPGARFCHRCGTPAAGGLRPATGLAGAAPILAVPPDRLPWIAAAAIIILTVAAIIWRVTGDNAPTPAGGGVAATTAPAGAPGAPPDISQMTPMERFIRLNDRIMMAAAQGDTATVQTFLPMALSAYEQLPAVDTDARYHAALLRAEGKEFDAARAIADTILTAEPANLIGLTLLGTVGELTGNPTLLADARRRFLAAWDAEIGKPNQEYLDHREVLDAFRAGAGG
ncbi:MAG TPA: zinc ribbon domain-containing protein [Gemmatimonadales bacterium]|nr:zinc ribbon domain-containing protein [Gemmatimonadales bacterium]